MRTLPFDILQKIAYHATTPTLSLAVLSESPIDYSHCDYSSSAIETELRETEDTKKAFAAVSEIFLDAVEIHLPNVIQFTDDNKRYWARTSHALCSNERLIPSSRNTDSVYFTIPSPKGNPVPETYPIHASHIRSLIVRVHNCNNTLLDSLSCILPRARSLTKIVIHVDNYGTDTNHKRMTDIIFKSECSDRFTEVDWATTSFDYRGVLFRSLSQPTALRRLNLRLPSTTVTNDTDTTPTCLPSLQTLQIAPSTNSGVGNQFDLFTEINLPHLHSLVIKGVILPQELSKFLQRHATRIQAIEMETLRMSTLTILNKCPGAVDVILDVRYALPTSLPHPNVHRVGIKGFNFYYHVGQSILTRFTRRLETLMDTDYYPKLESIHLLDFDNNLFYIIHWRREILLTILGWIQTAMFNGIPIYDHSGHMVQFDLSRITFEN